MSNQTTGPVGTVNRLNGIIAAVKGSTTRWQVVHQPDPASTDRPRRAYFLIDRQRQNRADPLEGTLFLGTTAAQSTNKLAQVLVQHAVEATRAAEQQARTGAEPPQIDAETGEIRDLLNFATYQTRAQATALYNEDRALTYCVGGLVEEALELLRLHNRIMRGDYSAESRQDDIAAEAGDALWMIAGIAAAIGIPLHDIAERNLNKLARRRAKHSLRGEGDHR